jgi:transcriptional regulator with XRE-family HTH domain
MTTIRQHGTYAKYSVEGCRCEQCRAVVRVYSNQRNRLKAYGQWQPYVDAEPARQHVKALMAYGIGWMRIADLAGVPRGSVSRLLYGATNPPRPPSHRIRPETEQKLLAVTATPENRGATTGVDATGTRRRLQALVAVGWSIRRMAVRLGMEHATLSTVANGSRTTVYASTAQAVAALYDDLWNQQPPQATKNERVSVVKAKRQAQRLRWAPPGAWDDDEIDNPDARPNLGTKSKRGDAMVEDSDWLIAHGDTLEQAAERLGVQPATLRRARERARQREQVPA